MYIFFNNIFFNKSLSLRKSARTGANLSTSNLSFFFFRLLKLLGTFFNLSISNLSILDLKLDKSNFIADFNESTPIVSFKSAFFA